MLGSSWISIVVLALAAACGSSGDSDNDPGGGDIESAEDVQQFLEAVSPELIAIFTDLADQLEVPTAAVSPNQGSELSASCPEGGSVTVDANSGMAMLSECGAEGVVLNATLSLFVSPPITDPFTEETFYSASFFGPLDVSGSFRGTILVDSAFLSWTDPLSDETTFWEVSASLGGESVFVSRAGSGSTPDPSGDVTALRRNLLV